MTSHETAVVIGLGIVGFLLVALIVALFMSGGSLRMRIAVVGRDRKIRAEWASKRSIHSRNGHPWYEFRGALYDWAGPWYAFEYRMVRSFGLRKYTGAQRIYLDGNPSPYRFDEDDRMKALRGTAEAMYHEEETDLPNRLLRPRRVDFVLLLVIGVMMLAVGLAAGTMLARGN